MKVPAGEESAQPADAGATLIDEIRRGFDLPSDVAVAAFLGLSAPAVHQIRAGKMGLSPVQRLRVLDKLTLLDKLKVLDRVGSLRVRGLLERIAPEFLTRKLWEVNREIANRVANKRLSSSVAPTPDAELIDAFKAHCGYATDAELAEALGLARQTMSSVRAGRTTLGPRPRLRMLNRLQPFELELVESVLDSTDVLVDLIRRVAEAEEAEGDDDGKYEGQG